MFLHMHLESAVPGCEANEWTFISANNHVFKTGEEDKVEAIAALLDDCVASMVVATLPEDYEWPLATLSTQFGKSFGRNGYIYAEDIDKLCEILGVSFAELFGEMAELECKDRKYARIIAAFCDINNDN